MKKMLPLVVLSFASLAWVLVAPLLFFADVLSLPQTTLHLLIATCVWFVATPWWMGKGGQVKAGG